MSSLSRAYFPALVVASSAAFALFWRTRPEPFMDEVFHVPQAQRYCQGRFTEWDPKITTLPGLYFISIGVLTPLAHAAAAMNSTVPMADANGEPSFCTTLHLRVINLVLSLVTALILNKLTTQIHGDKHYFDEAKATLSALNMSIFPLFYFFSFFYYTDVGSTFLVLFMYCLSLEGKDWLASFIGLLAVGFRQSNIVWVAFVAAQSAGPFLMHTVHAEMVERPAPVKFHLTTLGQTKELAEGVVLLVLDPRRLLRFVGDVLVVCGGYLVVWMLFVAFLAWNGGVVVGDREAHVAVFHPTQVLYFVAFAAAFSAPFCAAKAVPFLHFCRRHYLAVAAACLAACAVADSYTMAHPYLLADNRHYTFYVWRRIVDVTPWSRFALVPAYVFGGFCVLHSLRKTPIVFKLTYPVFVATALSPQLLLEFRYFIVPYLLYRLQVRPTCWWRLWAETAIYAAINAFTAAVFVLKPFRWEHEPEDVQRIIW